MEEKSQQDCAKAVVVQRWQISGENSEALAYSMCLDRTNLRDKLQDAIAILGEEVSKAAD